MEITTYNMRLLSPFFVRYWGGNEEDDIQLTARWVTEYERARSMSPEEYRKELEKKGLWNFPTPKSRNGQNGSQGGKRNG